MKYINTYIDKIYFYNYWIELKLSSVAVTVSILGHDYSNRIQKIRLIVGYTVSIVAR